MALKAQIGLHFTIWAFRALIWHDLSHLKYPEFKILAQENNKVHLFEEMTFWIKATFTYYLKSRESLFQSKRENWKKKCWITIRNYCTPLWSTSDLLPNKPLKAVMQHSCRKTHNIFFLVALLPFRQQYVVSVCQKYSMFQWWDSTKLLDLGHAHNS